MSYVEMLEQCDQIRSDQIIECSLAGPLGDGASSTV